MQRPEQLEFNPYFQQYIDLVQGGNFLDLLKQNSETAKQFFSEIPAGKLNYKYAANKWTIKDILMHITDTERVFAYRTLVCIREDLSTILFGMDENIYASNVDVSKRTIESLIEEFLTVRKNSEILFENITDAQSKILKNISNHNLSPRAMGYFLIGHTKHHLNVIKEKYL